MPGYGYLDPTLSQSRLAAGRVGFSQLDAFVCTCWFFGMQAALAQVHMRGWSRNTWAPLYRLRIAICLLLVFQIL